MMTLRLGGRANRQTRPRGVLLYDTQPVASARCSTPDQVEDRHSAAVLTRTPGPSRARPRSGGGVSSAQRLVHAHHPVWIQMVPSTSPAG